MFGDGMNAGPQKVVGRVHQPQPSPSPSTSPPVSATTEDFADDERSSSGSTIMGPTCGQDASDDDEYQRVLSYPGEDDRPTSRKELFGFYAYSFAAEVFIICGVGSFIPITLEQLARERGFLQADRSIPCTSALHGAPDLDSANKNNGQCIVSILGVEVNTASFAMYTFSISVFLQSIIVITFSGAADHGRFRKALLLAFAIVGAISTMLFLLITSKVYLLAAIFAIISNVCCASSFVLLNSFLPVLVRWHPYVRRGERQIRDQSSFTEQNERSGSRLSGSDGLNESTRLLSSASTEPVCALQPKYSREMRISTEISSYAMGIGYIGAVTLQTLSMFIVVSTGSTTFSLRLVLFTVGLWWLVFTIPAAWGLRPRPGPPLSAMNDSGNSRRTWSGYLAYSWINLGHTVVRARKLKDVLLFLAAWFMISDAIATVSGTAVLFAKTSLGMRPAALAAINVITTLSGVIGAFSWSKVSGMMGLTPIQTILACICIFELIPIYGLIGYIPAVQRAGVGGLQQPWEMYPLGAVYGLVLGGLGSYCRSLFGELIPEGSEAAFYALYAVTDKGSSIFGPVIVGAITDMTGEIRPAFWSLAALIALPLPILCLVDVERGKREGAALAREHLTVMAVEPEINARTVRGTEDD